MSDSPPKTVIVLAGEPPWAADFAAALPPDVALLPLSGRKRYLTRLTDALASLLIVDGADADWLTYTAAPKSSPATRRVPLLVAVDDPARRAEALGSGANLALSVADLLKDVPALIAQHARLHDPDREAQLDCECGEPLPELAVQGVEKFNDRQFYPQHDLFEEQWMNTDGPVRDLYRAILQVGVAYYQIERGNHRGALKMLLRAVQWLEALPDVCQTIDVAQLRADAYAVRAALEAKPAAEIANFDRTLLKPLVRVSEG